MINTLDKNRVVYNICFIALVIAISMDLFIRGYPEKIFYIVSYVSIFYTAVSFYKERSAVFNNKSFLLFFGVILILGLTRLVWAIVFKNTHFTDIVDNYHTTGKRLIISAFVFYYFYHFRHLLQSNALKLGVVIMLAGLLISLWYGHAEHSHTLQRVKWTSDAATTGSGLAFFVCMMAAIFVRACFKMTRFSLCLFVIVFLINMDMVLLTETRAAIFLTPVIYFLFFLNFYHNISRKLKVILLLLLIVTASSVVYFTWDRMSQISRDISEYSTNNDTSVGARFSIWKAGWYSVEPDLFGQSVDKRYEKAEEYLHEYERANPEAVKNIAYHLHNDLLETLSLQGIFGFVMLILFYISGCYFALKNGGRGNAFVLFIVFPVFSFGITDTMLIQSNTFLIILIATALSAAVMKKTEPTPVPVY